MRGATRELAFGGGRRLLSVTCVDPAPGGEDALRRQPQTTPQRLLGSSSPGSSFKGVSLKLVVDKFTTKSYVENRYSENPQKGKPALESVQAQAPFDFALWSALKVQRFRVLRYESEAISLFRHCDAPFAVHHRSCVRLNTEVAEIWGVTASGDERCWLTLPDTKTFMVAICKLG